MPHNNATEAGAGSIRVQRSSWEQGQPPHAFVVAASARSGIKGTRLDENHLRIGMHDVEKRHGGKGSEVLVRYQVAYVCGVAAGWSHVGGQGAAAGSPVHLKEKQRRVVVKHVVFGDL